MNSQPYTANENALAKTSHHSVDFEDQQLLERALNESDWSHGELTPEFENLFAQFCGCRYAVLVTNGTAAIRISLLAAGIQPGDQVIVPGLTWPSVIIAVLECGAEPVPVDIDLQTFGLSIEAVVNSITERTRGIIASHLFCSQTDLPPLLTIARERGLALIEDAAHVVGTRRFGRALGTFGIAGAFSFNQKKLLACGEGGCLVTNDEAIFNTAMRLRAVNPGQEVQAGGLSSPCKASEFQAAVLISQLRKLPERLADMEKKAEILRRLLSNHPQIRVLERLPNTDAQSFYGFCFRVSETDKVGLLRRELSDALQTEVLGAYAPVSETPALKCGSDARYKHLCRYLYRRLPNCMAAHYGQAVRIRHAFLRFLAENDLEIVAKCIRAKVNDYCRPAEAARCATASATS